MMFNSAFALGWDVSSRTGRIKWTLVVAAAFAAASTIDLVTGFGLAIPDEVISEVEAAAQKTIRPESGKKAAPGN